MPSTLSKVASTASLNYRHRAALFYVLGKAMCYFPMGHSAFQLYPLFSKDNSHKCNFDSQMNIHKCEGQPEVDLKYLEQHE